jgi:hypothetical protein
VREALAAPRLAPWATLLRPLRGLTYLANLRLRTLSYLRLVQITFEPAGQDVRLRRLLCGKAAPFRRRVSKPNSFFAGWKAGPSSRRRGGKEVSWAASPDVSFPPRRIGASSSGNQPPVWVPALRQAQGRPFARTAPRSARRRAVNGVGQQ